ncbi:hypothetical protein SAMN00768000_2433 [Sulfobacillus thermosulfidooxidans DSM 9293]|uniref:Uncharacterized protein n=1 Tax=Sulfobacillus thermosulfidooxidans (strain DSM 9293 / VKM B-1269 / AT-1) TaxID=929705 RepID=A0A1W1WHY2_SULTA|nr:hypothetical protein SAMN00768000_2433 [Sulfobacillus thermosulfidooxidans DSM 9293]
MIFGENPRVFLVERSFSHRRPLQRTSCQYSGSRSRMARYYIMAFQAVDYDIAR